MTRHKLTVVVSQAQGKNPQKRGLEESLVAALLVEPGVDVSVVPHLYDLGPDHTGRLFLESVRGDMVVLSWLYPRAAFWLLDRDGIQGKMGETRLKPPADDEEEEQGEPEPPKGIGALNPPDRYIYCLDLRDFATHEPYVAEVRRIAAESQARAAARSASAPGTLVELGLRLVAGAAGNPGSRRSQSPEDGTTNGVAAQAPPRQFTPEQLLAEPGRRWYPVIDYSRCTNCLECLDFCLFGVYAVDEHERIKVDQQDNCKRGCPACSRVCPEHAIMFPDYKTPAIAGAPIGGIDALKIDLTKLFGGSDAIKIAAQERDRELVRDGREAVGLSVGIPKRQSGQPPKPKDDLDQLMDQLDELEL